MRPGARDRNEGTSRGQAAAGIAMTVALLVAGAAGGMAAPEGVTPRDPVRHWILPAAAEPPAAGLASDTHGNRCGFLGLPPLERCERFEARSGRGLPGASESLVGATLTPDGRRWVVVSSVTDPGTHDSSIHVAAVDTRDGTEAWNLTFEPAPVRLFEFEDRSAFAASVAADGRGDLLLVAGSVLTGWIPFSENAYISDYDVLVLAVDLARGELRWNRTWKGPQGWDHGLAAAAAAGTLYVAASMQTTSGPDCCLYDEAAALLAYRTADGSLTASVTVDGPGNATLPGGLVSTPAGDVIFVSTYDYDFQPWTNAPSEGRVLRAFGGAALDARWTKALEGAFGPSVSPLAVDPSGLRLYVGSEWGPEVTALDPRSGATLWSSPSPTDAGMGVHPSPDGAWLATSTAPGYRETAAWDVRLQDAATGAEAWRWTAGDAGRIADVAFSPDGGLLYATGSLGGDAATVALRIGDGSLAWLDRYGEGWADRGEAVAALPGGDRVLVAAAKHVRGSWNPEMASVSLAYQEGVPSAVLAVVSTGINPYHEAFRDRSPMADRHPCTYLPGFPCDAPALHLTLDAATLEEAMAADRAVWERLEEGTLYWIPETRIAGAIRVSPGGVACPLASVPPLHLLGGDLAGLGTCPADLPVLDEHGEGTMAASRAAASEHSLCPECRIVAVEGPGPDGVRWAAEQPWIDLQVAPWTGAEPRLADLHEDGSLPSCPPAAPSCLLEDGGLAAFRHAGARMAVFAAAGDGLAGQGVAPAPSALDGAAAPGVVQVGGHDNGRATLWSGSPPFFVADAYGGWSADHRSLRGMAPRPETCCTAAAAPYAAGAYANLLLRARELAGDDGTGDRGGVPAQGTRPPWMGGGPLMDGALSRAEGLRLVAATAVTTGMEGPDDGLLHWTGARRTPTLADLDPYGPAGNPRCAGCLTTPLSWQVAAAGVLALTVSTEVLHAGYGAVNPGSLASARAVLEWAQPEPRRFVEDAFFAAYAQIRGAVDQVP